MRVLGALREILEDDPGWRTAAACTGDARFTRPDVDPEVLRAVCAECAVRGSCLAEALTNEERHDIWGGLDFAERAAYCPVCGDAKVPQELGCTPAHSLIRLVHLMEMELAGDPDVLVGSKLRPSARTSEDCPVPLGQSHDSGRAYRHGCRCRPAYEAKMGRAS